jgi:hypothetical protein
MAEALIFIPHVRTSRDFLFFIKELTDASQLYAGSSFNFLLIFLFAFICLQTNANKREENDDERSVS